jgi:prepilin peptidase CpaA
MIGVNRVIDATLVALLAGCIFSDVRRRVIPNILCAAVAVLGLIAGLIEDPAAVIYPVLGGALLIVGGLALHRKGVLGGGDVKLMAALAIWLTPIEMGRFVLCTMMAGGVVGAGYLIAGFARRLRDKTAPAASGVPYALAIVVGFYFLRPDRVLLLLRA